MSSKGVLIRLSDNTLERLHKYLEKLYGEHRGLSLTMERAIREFLDRENGSSPEIKK